MLPSFNTTGSSKRKRERGQHNSGGSVIKRLTSDHGAMSCPHGDVGLSVCDMHYVNGDGAISKKQRVEENK